MYIFICRQASLPKHCCLMGPGSGSNAQPTVSKFDTNNICKYVALSRNVTECVLWFVFLTYFYFNSWVEYNLKKQNFLDISDHYGNIVLHVGILLVGNPFALRFSRKLGLPSLALVPLCPGKDATDGPKPTTSPVWQRQPLSDPWPLLFRQVATTYPGI